MKLNRRQFLLLTAGLATGCQSMDDVGKTALGTERLIDAGKAADYATDGVYSRFVNQGFFLVRKSGQFFALSAICTHRKCKLKAEPDDSFYCKCHGSTFDPDGHVTEGPARRDLPKFPVSVDANKGLTVKLNTA